MELNGFALESTFGGIPPDADAREVIAALEQRIAALQARLAAREANPTSAPSHVTSGDQQALASRLLDSVDTLVVILDQDARIVLLNRAAEEMGEVRAIDVLGKYVWDLFTGPGEAELAKVVFAQLRTGVFSPELERFSIIKQGERRYVQWSNRLLVVSPDEPAYVVITGVDVTKRRTAERALKSQVAFEQLVSTVSRRLIGLTPETFATGVNEALSAVANMAQVQGCSVWLFDDHQQTIVRQYDWTFGAAGPAPGGPLRFRVEDVQWLAHRILSGQVVAYRSHNDLPPPVAEMILQSELNWIQSFMSAPLICGGRPIGWICLESATNRDWTPAIISLTTVVAEMLAGTLERIRSEQAVRQSEETMRAVVQNMPVMLLALDAAPDFSVEPLQYNIIAWNQECERVTGYAAGEIINNPGAQALLYPNEQQRVQIESEWRDLGDEFRHQAWPMRAKDGTLKTIAWSDLSHTFPIPGWARWGIGIDVTDQTEAQAALKRARDELEVRVAERTVELSAANESLTREVASREQTEQALLRQTEILKSILDSIGEGIAVADEQGHLVLFNPASEQILGTGAVAGPPSIWSPQYGTYLPDGETPYPPDQLPLVRATRGESTNDVEVLLRNDQLRGDVWVSVNGRPIRDEQENLRGGVVVFRDVTEQKRAREELQAEQRTLRQLLLAHERDRQLLAYEIHDGFVQDVTGAVMHLEAYLRQKARHSDRADDEFNYSLRLLRKTIDEARRFISGLRPPILDEQGIVAAIEYLVNEQAASGSLKITFRHKFQSRRLDTLLEGTMYRIVQEALNNVRRHSQAQRAEVTLTETADSVRLEIRDFGAGFDQRQIAENRFGLESIRERARLLRGSSVIESTPGRGTRVLVELPLTHSQRNE